MDRCINGWIDGKFGEQSRQVTTTDVSVTTGGGQSEHFYFKGSSAKRGAHKSDTCIDV